MNVSAGAPAPPPPASPWVVQVPKQTAQVPVGRYFADFQGVNEIKLQDGSQKWRWEWAVTTGPEAGKVASALTDQSISPTTLPGVLISGLIGRAIVAGENVKAALDACKGKPYLVSVQPGPKGGKPCVRMASKPPQM